MQAEHKDKPEPSSAEPNQTPKSVFKRNRNSWMSPTTIRSFLSPRCHLCCRPLWLEEAEDGVSTLGDMVCSRLEPGSVSRDGGRFQLGCLYINKLSKPQLKNNLGAVLGAGGEEKKRKPKKPLASSAPSAEIHMTSHTWGCLDETRLLSRARPMRLGSETVTSWTQPPRTAAEHMGRGKQGGKYPGMKREPISQTQEAPSVGADVPQTRCAQSRAKLVTTHGLGFKPTVLEVARAPYCSC